MAFVIDETNSDIAELICKDFGSNPKLQNLKHDFIDWVHYRARRVPCRPRQIMMSPEVQAKLSMYPAIGRICSAIRAGEDMSAWLSRKIDERKRNPRADMMFNDWQITHFHLGQVFEKPNMIHGTENLLYAHVSADLVTLLDVLPHNNWAAQNLLRILLETRPDAMKRFEVKNWPGQALTDDQLLTLRENGRSVVITISGRAFLIFGIAGSRHAMRLLRFCNHLHRTITAIKNRIEQGTIEQAIASLVVCQIGVPVRLGISFNREGVFTIYDKTRPITFFQSSGIE